MTLVLKGVGTALPPHSISQADAAQLARRFHPGPDEEARLLPLLYRRSGVKQRQSVLLHTPEGPPEERQSFFPPSKANGSRGPSIGERMQVYEREAPPLAVAAATRALQTSGVSSRDITHLITVSCSGFMAPGLEVPLIRELPLRPTVARTQIGFMGCHGALNGLRVATAFVQADPSAHVLLCAVELCSLHFHYSAESDKVVANALFADGAAAAVLGAESANRPEPWRLAASGSLVIPDSEDAMSWRIRDHGFEMTLSSRVPDLIRQHLRGWLVEWLARQELTLEEIGCWAVHPGGPRILAAVEEALQLPPEALAPSRDVLSECGNMSSPTVLFICERLRREGARPPCVMLGFGPGLVAEAALFAPPR